MGRPAVKLTADTNLLVRIVVRDDESQAHAAFNLLSTADRVVVSLPCLCEFAWVLRSVYGYGPEGIETAVHSITDPENVMTDQAAVEAGLRINALGGDFADGVIASAGLAMGSETFVSFDRRAVKRLDQIGFSARHASDVA